MWNIVYDANLSIKRKQTHRHREQMHGRPKERRWGEIDWEFGTSRCKLLYMEQINSEVLLYSTENYIQYPVINHNGKEKNKKAFVAALYKG